MAIRSYGPGKFDTILDSYVYAVSLDGGADEEMGDVGGFGWYGMMGNDEGVLASAVIAEAKRAGEPLNKDETSFILSAKGGVIMTEDNQGFVGVAYFTSEKARRKRWKEIEEEYAEFEEEYESEDYD